MAQVLLLLVVALTVGAVVFGVMVLVSGGDPGLSGVEPDGRGRALPGSRPLVEQDVAKVTFDVGLRGYRMDQVDKALKRVAYDIGYKDELISVLSAEVDALRDGRAEDAEALRAARLAASGDQAVPAPELIDGTVTESGSPSDTITVTAEPAADSAVSGADETPVPADADVDFVDEVPDGPFAPWPAARATTDTPAEADEPDHPTDAPEEIAADADAAAEEETAPAEDTVQAEGTAAGKRAKGRKPSKAAADAPQEDAADTTEVDDADRVVTRG
ncbi:MAG: DivIVA domain-containing protein [Hamadaea sp.]|nr:DivIVA domain-containing protein [Hamadaea sp.]